MTPVSGADRAAKPRIVVTQGEGASGSLALSLAALGAEPVALPMIAIEPPADWGPLDRELSSLERFDWIVFTSRHAVEAVTGRPAWQGAREKEIPGLRVAAVGRATAKSLARSGVTADLVPDEAGGAQLAALMASTIGRSVLPALETPTRSGAALAGESRGDDVGTPPGPREHLAQTGPSRVPLAGVLVLWPRSDIALRAMPDALRVAGAEVVDPVAYRNVFPTGSDVKQIASLLLEGRIDAVTFMSPSSANNLATILGWPDLTPLARRTAIASIGPSTSETLRELGAPADVESTARTADDLARVLLAYLERP